MTLSLSLASVARPLRRRHLLEKTTYSNLTRREKQLRRRGEEEKW